MGVGGDALRGLRSHNPDWRRNTFVSQNFQMETISGVLGKELVAGIGLDTLAL